MTTLLPRVAALASAAAVAACAAADPSPRPADAAPAADGAVASEGRGAAVVQPGAPGQDARVLTGAEVAALDQPAYTEADVAFMQGMIPHHAQALEMAALVPGRTDNRDVHLLARRIEISQRDEIALMERWLRDREEPLAPAGGGHGGHLMPGMLTPGEMERLASASGAAFDRLFLEAMIRHHQGALTMVSDLFSSVGGGQETDIFQFASHVDADQHIEIQRMRRMLDALP